MLSNIQNSPGIIFKSPSWSAISIFIREIGQMKKSWTFVHCLMYVWKIMFTKYSPGCLKKLIFVIGVKIVLFMNRS